MVTDKNIPPISLFFGWHDAHPAVLGNLLLRNFGLDMLEWEAEALQQSIKKDLGVLSISNSNWQKIQAFRTLLNTVSAWSEWEIFENIILAFNNIIPNPEVLQKCSVAQLLCGVTIINSIREYEWQEDIHKYIAACAIEQGITWLPEPLQNARPYIEKPYFKCPVCDHVVDVDSVAMKCVLSYDTEFPFNDQGSSPDCPLKKGWMRLVKKRVDGSSVGYLFEQWKELSELAFDETDFLAVQAAKLVVAYRYNMKKEKDLI